jgi:hypothetical protein
MMRLQESAPQSPPVPVRRRRWRVAIISVLTVLVVVAAIVVARIEEPLRKYIERQINGSLDGYTVSIGKLDLHLLGLAVELENVTLVQDARPSPPMLDLPSWRTSVEWRALLSFALVADTIFERPRVDITFEQSKTEARDPVPVTDRGWQDALQAVYPLKINTLRVVDGYVSYYDGNVPPVQLQHVQFRATNIRNVQSAPGAFPSPVELRAEVLGGSVSARGGADFFAKPYPTLATDVDLRDANLLPLAPIAKQYDLTLKQGKVAGAGRLVVETKETSVDLARLEITNPVIVYARDPRPAERPVERAVEAAAEAATEPGVRVDLRDVRIRNGSLALQVDALRSPDGRTVYVEGKDLPPLRLDEIDLHATEISSEAREKGPPTRFELRAKALDNGYVTVSGTADLLAKPTPTTVADFQLRGMKLKPFGPIVEHWAFVLDDGELGALGRLTVDRSQTALLLRRIVATNPVVSYVQRTATDERRIERATRAATDPEPAPGFRLDVEDARIRGGRFTFVNAAANPPYTLALTHSDVGVRGFSNQQSKRRGGATVRGRFMESGRAAIDATFASGTRQADFDMKVSLEDVQLVELNDLLRATGDFDVVAGRFSFFSEMVVQDGRVRGYVKPFLESIDVYDRKQDSRKGVGQQMYEGLVGAAGSVLENRGSDQIATRADLSGPIEDPNARTWQIVVGLVRNAFWRALMPGLDQFRTRR